MKSLSKDYGRKDHVSTLVNPALDKLDEWMKDVHHQIYTVIGLSLIVMVSWIVWRVKR
jgi:hypothetical protein